MLSSLLDLIFPPRCAACLEILPRDEALCGPCRARIELRRTLVCFVCRARLPDGAKICHADAPCRLGFAAPYADPRMEALVRALKFRNIRSAAAPLGRLLAEYVRHTGIPLEGAVVVPVPLGRWRRRTRGFNQAEEIALAFAAELGLPFHPDALARTRETKPQTELPAEGRRKNLAGAFSAGSGALPPHSFAFLVDDVVTSGATLGAAAEALKQAGGRRIVALAAAGA